MTDSMWQDRQYPHNKFCLIIDDMHVTNSSDDKQYSCYDGQLHA